MGLISTAGPFRTRPQASKPKTVTFSGHSVVISDLLSDSEYTFTLLAPDNTLLTGAISTPLSTVPTVELLPDSVAIALSSSSAILTWQYDGDAPKSGSSLSRTRPALRKRRRSPPRT